MSDIQTFFSWFLSKLPPFLMSDPIKYFWGILLFAYIIKIILSMRRL